MDTYKEKLRYEKYVNNAYKNYIKIIKKIDTGLNVNDKDTSELRKFLFQKVNFKNIKKS